MQVTKIKNLKKKLISANLMRKNVPFHYKNTCSILSNAAEKIK
jgi:hypothetical protein